MTPGWQGDAAIGILPNVVNGRTMMDTGIMLRTDYIGTLPGFLTSIIGTFQLETLLSVMIFLDHRPLVIFGKSSFVKENDNAFNDCLFCDLLL